MQLSENLSQELAQWYTREAGQNRGLNAPGLYETALSDQQRRTRDAMVSTFLAQRRQEIYQEVEPRLRAPDLVDVTPPPIATEADVAGKYHPHGVETLPSAPPAPSGGAATTQISEGKRTLADEQGAQGVMRAGHVIAGADVQSEVSTDLNRNFFVDPKLRK